MWVHEVLISSAEMHHEREDGMSGSWLIKTFDFATVIVVRFTFLYATCPSCPTNHVGAMTSVVVLL